MKTWTQEELDALNQWFALLPNEELMLKLPNKTYRSITVKAHRLGLKKTEALRSLMQQGANNHFANHTHSETTKQTMKEIWYERKNDPKWIHCWVGKKHTIETKQLLSDIAKTNPLQNHPCPSGFIMPEEWKAKLRHPKVWTEEGKQAIRDSVMSRPVGGYGNWQQYIRKDGEVVWLQSSYEVRAATAFDKYNYVWSRNTTVGFEWTDSNDKNHIHYPDFIVTHDGKDIFVEVKGEHLIGLEDTITKASCAIEKLGGCYLLVTLSEIEHLENTGWFY